jgi:thiol:disulfide interchange protein DsbD
VLTGILAWIAKTKSAGLGALAMAAFALGLGVPFFVVGTFAVQLPKSGRWMVHVKSLLGIVLVVVALYFLSTAFPVLGASVHPSPLLFGVASAAAVFGLLLGAVHREFSDPILGVKVAKGSGIVLTSAGLFALVLGLAKPAEALAWQHGNVEAARARALAESRPLIVDFTAAWCGACKELDKLTFSAAPVGAELGRFVAVRVDATNDEDPQVGAALQHFGVRGLPTVVVYDSRGKEALRFTDFVPPEQFLDGIRAVD